jgi:biopolymer transport protein ExbD
MRKKREFLTPDLTPLIDVVFLLLIFFLVSSVFKKEEFALLLNLPVSEAQKKGANDNSKSITIEINNDSFAFNGQKIARSEIEEKLKALESKTPINLRSDELTPYKEVVFVLNILQKLKLQNISLITEPVKVEDE